MIGELRSKNTVVGMRRSLKIIEAGCAKKAFIAGNVEPTITRKLLDACRQNGVALELVATKAELGKACGIDVDAAVAVIKKD